MMGATILTALTQHNLEGYECQTVFGSWNAARLGQFPELSCSAFKRGFHALCPPPFLRSSRTNKDCFGLGSVTAFQPMGGQCKEKKPLLVVGPNPRHHRRVITIDHWSSTRLNAFDFENRSCQRYGPLVTDEGLESSS